MSLLNFLFINALVSSSESHGSKDGKATETDINDSEGYDFSGWDDAMCRISSPSAIASNLIAIILLLIAWVIFDYLKRYL